MTAVPDDSNAANNEHADATFITAARTAVPALVAALRSERAENQRLRATVTELHAMERHLPYEAQLLVRGTTHATLAGKEGGNG